MLKAKEASHGSPEDAPSEESLRLAQNVLNLIYEECQDNWSTEATPEPLNAPYREIPKRSAFRDSKDKSRQQYRGWSIVVQRDPDGGATIFYAGEIPNSGVHFGSHAKELKIFSAHPERGLRAGFINLQVENDDQRLSNLVAEWKQKNKKDWREVLVPYDQLRLGDKVSTRSLLEGDGKGKASALFTEIRRDFILRGLSLGGEFLP